LATSAFSPLSLSAVHSTLFLSYVSLIVGGSTEEEETTARHYTISMAHGGTKDEEEAAWPPYPAATRRKMRWRRGLHGPRWHGGREGGGVASMAHGARGGRGGGGAASMACGDAEEEQVVEWPPWPAARAEEDEAAARAEDEEAAAWPPGPAAVRRKSRRRRDLHGPRR